MKVVNIEWQRKIVLEENIIHTLVFENKKYYREVVSSLIKQHDGKEGKFILSKDTKELSFEKSSFFISDLFDIDLNSKKILTKVYGSLQKQVIADIVEYNEISTLVFDYFERLILNSSLDIEQKDELDIGAFLKLADFKIQYDEKNHMEKLVQYLKLLIELCGVKVIFIVGLHSFFNEEEIKQFYKEICLNKIHIINLETSEFKRSSSNLYEEKIYIFDEENCEI